jgi:MFS family permease
VTDVEEPDPQVHPREADDRGEERLLGIPVVRRLVLAYLGSSAGAAAGSVGVAFVAYRESSSVVLTVLVLAGNTLPFMLLAPASGRLVTRHDPRHLLAASHGTKALLLALAATLAAAGELDYLVLLAGTFVYGSLSAVAAPVWPRLFEVIAPPGRLADVTALFQSVFGGAMIIGAVIGGSMIALVGIASVFAANALTYLPVVLVVLTLPRLAPMPGTRAGVLRTGARAVARAATLRRAFLLSAILNLTVFPVLSTLPAMARDIEPGGHVLGYLTGAFYVGAALVAWVVVRLRRRFAPSRILFAGYLVGGVLLLVHTVLTDWRDTGYDAVITAVVTLLPIGLAVTTTAVLLQALVQLECDDGVEAGVLILYATTASLVTPIGGVLIGAAIDTWSIWWGVGAPGVALIVVALALRRRLDVFDTVEGSLHPSATRAVDHHWTLHLRSTLGGDLAPYAWRLHRR